MNQLFVITNRSPLAATDGWIHIVPKGELPNAEAKLVQVLDDTAMDSILSRIESDKARLGDKWPGVYAGREHFIYDDTKDSAALAWFKEFEKRPDGIWAKDDGLTPAGQAAVKNREYKFTSFCADPADVKKIEGNRYRVLAIETVGFTNQANGKELLTPITNRGENHFADAGASAANQPTTPKKNMKQIATKLGLAAEASEEAILAEVTKLMNRADITPADLTTLKNRDTQFAALETEIKTLRADQAATLLDACGVKEEKLRNRHTAAMAPLKNREDCLAYLADFGLAPGAAKPAEQKTAGRILNRGQGGQGGVETPAADAAADEAKAQKIMNRAKAIRKETPTIGLATATQMATDEIG